MQNLYVINSAISNKKSQAYKTALIIIFFDITLAFASFFGVGLLLKKIPFLKGAVLFLGSLILIYIGISLFKSRPEFEKIDTDKSLLKITFISFTVTWLNPQALIDGSLLLGGFKASLPAASSNIFISGVALASFTWFIALVTVITSFKNIFNEKVIRIINIACGTVIIFYGLKLGYNFIQFIK
jgi:L-lysine exporter family protein LysE/ArgO